MTLHTCSKEPPAEIVLFGMPFLTPKEPSINLFRSYSQSELLFTLKVNWKVVITFCHCWMNSPIIVNKRGKNDISEHFVIEYWTLLSQIMSAFSVTIEPILYKAAISLFWKWRDTNSSGDYSFKCVISFILHAGLNVTKIFWYQMGEWW